MSQIAVPAERPAAGRPYVPRHLAPEPEPEPVGERTRECRPYTLAEAEGPTRRIETTSGFLRLARAVWQYGRGAR